MHEKLQKNRSCDHVTNYDQTIDAASRRWSVKRQQKLLPIKLDSVTELRRSLDSDHGSLSPVESSLFMSISSRPSLILVTETFHFSFIHGFSCESGWTKAETQHQQPRPPPQSGRTIRPLETTLIHYLTSSSLHPMIQFYSHFFLTTVSF